MIKKFKSKIKFILKIMLLMKLIIKKFKLSQNKM
jgi:hypothetical protein